TCCDMADTSTTFSASNPLVEDLLKDETKENIVDKEPSRYGFINPEALKNINDCGPSTLQYQSQGKTIGNVEGIPYTYPVPSTMNRPIGEIKTYRIWSALNIVCGCLILGLVAGYYSSETEELRNKGDIQGALNASRKARTINIIATIGGITAIIIYVLYKTGVIG
ncbi:unnamed protein product, partial [Rotaria sp. Silwood1]